MKKSQVIFALRKNKAKHFDEYKEAVIAFKEKGIKELTKNLEKVKKGALKVEITLVTPINRTEQFNTVIAMFEADVKQEVELTQTEYNDYILDRGSFAVAASLSNSAYYSSVSRKLKGK